MDPLEDLALAGQLTPAQPQDRPLAPAAMLQESAARVIDLVEQDRHDDQDERLCDVNTSARE
jgi:hypothetical protein